MYAFVGDIHLGVKLSNEDFLNSLDLFLYHIRTNKEPCHAIFICGDLFDKRLSIEETKFASTFIAKLCCNFCGKDQTHIPVYFIHGTYSHDLNQYEIYLPLLNKIENVNVFYVKTVDVLTLKNGKRVLCIPHENGNIDYSEFFKDDYDIIVGHGVIASNTKNPCKTDNGIIHSSEQLGDISKICVFGHYHGYTDFGDNVYYTGPWLRWKYGEDEPRVFFFCDDEYNVFTEPNPNALEFKTITIHNPEELRKHIAGDIKTPHRFIIESNSDDMNVYRAIIMNSQTNTNIKFQLTEIIDQDDLRLSMDEVINAQTESAQPVPALITYIKDKFGIDASEKISEYESQINKDKKGTDYND